MKKTMQADGWPCSFCREKAADTVYFHGTKLACPNCHDRIIKVEREQKQTNGKGE